MKLPPTLKVSFANTGEFRIHLTALTYLHRLYKWLTCTNDARRDWAVRLGSKILLFGLCECQLAASTKEYSNRRSFQSFAELLNSDLMVMMVLKVQVGHWKLGWGPFLGILSFQVPNISADRNLLGLGCCCCVSSIHLISYYESVCFFLWCDLMGCV